VFVLKVNVHISVLWFLWWLNTLLLYDRYFAIAGDIADYSVIILLSYCNLDLFGPYAKFWSKMHSVTSMPCIVTDHIAADFFSILG